MTQHGQFVFAKEGTEEDEAISQKMKDDHLLITNWKVIEKKTGEAATVSFKASSELVRTECLDSLIYCSGDKKSLRVDYRYRPSKTTTK